MNVKIVRITQSRLNVFLCHSSDDTPAVRSIYERLEADGFAPWLDEESLLPGQEWETEIRKAVRLSHVVLVCLSQKAITKEGYVQKEIKHALDVAGEKPQNTIYLIPLRLEPSTLPTRLSVKPRVDAFAHNGYEKLTRALQVRMPRSSCFESFCMLLRSFLRYVIDSNIVSRFWPWPDLSEPFKFRGLAPAQTLRHTFR